MIIVTPNFTIDRVVSVDELVSAGGEGVNVTRTLAAMDSRADLVCSPQGSLVEVTHDLRCSQNKRGAELLWTRHAT
ncbi:hypothetical protein I6E81_03150 [Salinibacterium sp. NG22]|uniref:hypothetical protein n=1 Tax=Salinibacterium sp. NG22 TaxID=2792040 RepID=UPI0018CCC734|nr:hypothetical protein [Salinibacterium sp. NG22]MBH0109159.1 hypothetical protein [Salinibacterium sp. NG22]